MMMGLRYKKIIKKVITGGDAIMYFKGTHLRTASPILRSSFFRIIFRVSSLAVHSNQEGKNRTDQSTQSHQSWDYY